MRVLALLDGSTADPELPFLRGDDLGVLRGDGLFETVLVVDGRPRKLDAHLERMARSAAMLDLPAPDPAGWRRCVDAACAAWVRGGGGHEMVLKLVITRGSDSSGDSSEAGFGGPDGPVTAYAVGAPVPPPVLRLRREGMAVVTLDRGFPAEVGTRAPWLLIGAKTLSYAVNMAAVRYARSVGADDAIFVSTDGWVLEGSTASVVIAEGRTLRTPPPNASLLPGTTQRELFRAAEGAGWTTRTEPLRVDDLLAADGVWLVSSVRLMIAVHTLDGTPLRRGGPDAELRALLT